MTHTETITGADVSMGHLLDADEIKGRRVITRDEEQIGSVDRLYLDVDEHTLRYVSIEIGGLQRIGAKNVLVPFELLQWSGRDLYLDVDRTTIEEAPEFDPGMEEDRAYEADVAAAWRVAPYWLTAAYGVNHEHRRERR